MDNLAKKTAIITGYKCNNHCRFCIYSDRRNVPDKTTRKIKQEMLSARKRGAGSLVLVGGEVFIRKDILDLIGKAREIGFSEVIAATNGRMFAYNNFAKRIVKSGITQIYFSIHGHNERVHDSLTSVPGSFKELIRGIRNLQNLGFKNLGTHTTIVKQNYKYLLNIAQVIYGLGIKNSDFVFVDPNYGGAHEAFVDLVPRISQVVPYLKKSLDFIGSTDVEHFAVRYVPVCRLEGYQEYVSDMRDINLVKTEHIGPDFVDYYVEKTRREMFRVKSAKCLMCLFYESCEGIWKEYLTHFSDKELRPITRPNLHKNSHPRQRVNIVDKAKTDISDFLRECKDSVVDIGSGDGGLFFELSNILKVKKLIALDNDISSFSNALLSGNKFLVQADARNMPFGSKTIDGIASHIGFNYVTRAEGAFAEMYRVLRKGGRLIFTNTVFDDSSRSYRKLVAQNRKVTSTAANIRMILKKCKFKNIAMKEVIKKVWNGGKEDNDNLQVAGEEYNVLLVSAEK